MSKKGRQSKSQRRCPLCKKLRRRWFPYNNLCMARRVLPAKVKMKDTSNELTVCHICQERRSDEFEIIQTRIWDNDGQRV